MATKKTKKTKTVKRKKAEKRDPVDVILVETQARFDALNEKIDTLLSRTALISRMVSTEQDSSFKTRATITKKFPPVEDKPRERKMYKVICADCKQSCEVPFIPRPDRPVYCKACFSKRRNDRNPVKLPAREELVAEISKTLNIDINQPPKKTKPSGSAAGKVKKATTKAKGSKIKKKKTQKTVKKAKKKR